MPASGFYEWKRDAGGKVPHYIFLRDTDSFAFAGLYEIWKDGDGNLLKTYTIITTTPNELMESIHNRMPVILSRDDEGVWLDKEADIPALQALLRPYPAKLMDAYVVSKAVNSPMHEGEVADRARARMTRLSVILSRGCPSGQGSLLTQPSVILQAAAKDLFKTPVLKRCFAAAQHDKPWNHFGPRELVVAPIFRVLAPILVLLLGVLALVAKCGDQASDKCLALGGRQPRIRVRQQVGPQRHLAIAILFRRLVALLVLAAPLRNVELRAGLLDVALHLPRDRGDIAVPRPDRLVAMAVRAGAEEERPRLWAVPGRFGLHRRVVWSRPKGINWIAITSSPKPIAPRLSRRPMRRRGRADGATEAPGFKARCDWFDDTNTPSIIIAT